MKDSHKFKLNALRRTWIEGVDADVFIQQVDSCLRQIKSVPAARIKQGVLISEEDPIRFTAAFFAAIYLEVPVILANPKWRKSEWKQLCEQVRPVLVFGEANLAGSNAETAKDPDSQAILIPTGGSSGKLKLAVHTWVTLTAACDGFRAFMGHDEPVHSCCVLPLYHVSGLMQVMRSFESGGQIAFTDYKMLQRGVFPKLNVENLCLSLVPTQLQRIIDSKVSFDWLCRLKAIFLGGAPMSEYLRSLVRSHHLPVIPTYGMTETAAMVTAVPVDEFVSGVEGVGRSLPHVNIQVVNKDGAPCLSGAIGHIKVQTDSLCHGYHKSSAAFSGKSYLSADEGYLDEAGRLHIIGRSDRIIISGGEKIDTLEVEDAIIKTGFAKQALAISWPDPEWGDRLIAFYVPVNKTDKIDTLKHQLKSSLANYKIPKRILKVDQLPVTLHGKLDRALIDSLFVRISQKD